MSPAPVRTQSEDKHRELQATLNDLARDLKQARQGPIASVKKIDGQLLSFNPMNIELADQTWGASVAVERRQNQASSSVGFNFQLVREGHELERSMKYAFIF
jgi:hypothetical protein